MRYEIEIEKRREKEKLVERESRKKREDNDWEGIVVPCFYSRRAYNKCIFV